MEREKRHLFCRYFSIKETTGARWGMLLGKARTIGAYSRIGKKSPPIKFPSPYFREWSVYAGGQSLSCTILPQNRIARNDCEQQTQTSPAGIYCYQPCSILHAVFLPQSHQVLRQFRGLSGEILHYFQPIIPCGEPPGAEAQFQEVHVLLIFLVFRVPSRGHVQIDHDPVRANQIETSRPVYQRRIADELTYFLIVELRIDLLRGNLPFPGNLMESLHKRAVVTLREKSIPASR